jgi:hypothetical protein
MKYSQTWSVLSLSLTLFLMARRPTNCTRILSLGATKTMEQVATRLLVKEQVEGMNTLFISDLRNITRNAWGKGYVAVTDENVINDLHLQVSFFLLHGVLAIFDDLAVWKRE